jgi:hypothetical protein
MGFPRDNPNATVRFLDYGTLRPRNSPREIAYAMQQFPAKTAARRSIGIQFTMEPSVPPEKRTSFPSPAMVYVIVGIIVMAFVLFLILRPR